MLLIVMLAVAQTKSDVVLQYRPDPTVSSVYFFTATGQHLNPEPGLKSKLDFSFTTIEKRTVVEQTEQQTILEIEATESLLHFSAELLKQRLEKSDLLAGQQESINGPITSLVTFDLVGNVVNASLLLKSKSLVPFYADYALSEGVLLSPYPKETLTKTTTWSLGLNRSLPIQKTFIVDEQFSVECRPLLPVHDGILDCVLVIPDITGVETGRAKQTVIVSMKGSGKASIIAKTGEMKSIHLVIDVTVNPLKYSTLLFQPDKLEKYQFIYSGKRISEYPIIKSTDKEPKNELMMTPAVQIR